MVRPLHPRRGTELRTVATPPRPAIDPAALVELRELVTSLAAREGARHDDSQALVRTLATQTRKLDELTALQSDTLRRVVEVDRRAQATPRERLTEMLRSAREAARNGLARLRAGPKRDRSGPSPEPAAKPLAWILADAKPGVERVVMVLLLGLTIEQQQVIVARLLVDEQLPLGVAPLFVTSETEFEHFRAHRAYFERLSLTPLHRAAEWRDHELYAARRFTLLCDKWKPLRVVAFGAAAAQQLEAWRASPHVAPAIRELLGEPETS